MNTNTTDSIFTADRKRLIEEALEARERALWLAPGPERDRLIRQARHCETGAGLALGRIFGPAAATARPPEAH